MDDARPRERLIDPLRIATHGDQTYLIAWDVEVDGQRSYRMDKIEGLALTDDSVERHTPVRYGSEHWLFCQVIAAGGAIRILDDPAQALRLCDMAKSLTFPL